MKNQVTKTKFLTWYFRNSDDIESMGYEVYQCLKFDDEFHITTEDLFNDCEYIPRHICEDDGEAEGLSEEEYSPNEVKLING